MLQNVVRYHGECLKLLRGSESEFSENVALNRLECDYLQLAARGVDESPIAVGSRCHLVPPCAVGSSSLHMLVRFISADSLQQIHRADDALLSILLARFFA